MASISSLGILREEALTETNKLTQALAAKYGVDAPQLDPMHRNPVPATDMVMLRFAIAQRELALLKFYASIFEKLEVKEVKVEEQTSAISRRTQKKN